MKDGRLRYCDKKLINICLENENVFMKYKKKLILLNYLILIKKLRKKHILFLSNICQ